MYTPSDFGGITYYCSNRETPGYTQDRIFIDPVDTTDQTVRNNGNNSVLKPGPAGSWDSVHVCDPSVVRGNFTYGDVNYPYLMAYLGCATTDCTQNEIGFAVSQDKVHWTKIGTNPVVSSRDRAKFFDASKGKYTWGVGQPSLINKNGTVYLFYSEGNVTETATYVRRLNSNNLDVTQLSEPVKISKPSGFEAECVHNADFAFTNNELYMICEGDRLDKTNGITKDPICGISGTSYVYKMAWNGTFESLGNNGWTFLRRIDGSLTNHLANHNACLRRNEDGSLRDNGVYVSTGDENPNQSAAYKDNIRSYRWIWLPNLW